MRSYLPVTPRQISLLIDTKKVDLTYGFSVTGVENADSEEQEFATSWLAASLSADINKGWGFVLVSEKELAGVAVDKNGYWQSIVEIQTSDVECVLVAECDTSEIEEELSWFAVQEIADHLPLWLTKVSE